ncbi:MAG: exo-alpha-sialidase [Candidatus Hydrogenedentes bacterium]|nr:exo-alpha-sialidase [Candidatus Hydrogenedentota bacterium]
MKHPRISRVAVYILCGLCLLALSAPALAAPLSPFEFGEKVRAAGGRLDFVFGADRPFPQCHASTAVEVSPGVLLSAWFGGTAEKDDDVGIWLAHFDGKKWGKPERLAKVDDTPHWNPVLFRDATGEVHLFFKIGKEIPYWQTYWMHSKDGKSWSEPKELVKDDKGGRGPVRSKPIILSDGAWLAPSSTELGTWEAFVDRSEDQGKTWSRTPNFDRETNQLTVKLKGKGAIQPTLWESSPGKVHALLRSTAGKVWRVDSEDGGKTWSPIQETELPNNNSGIDVLQLEDGRLLLIYNPIGKNWGPRTPIDLAVSKDNGATWDTIAHLEHDPDPESEFSYPAMVRSAGGIVITYTYQRERVRCWQIPLSALE